MKYLKLQIPATAPTTEFSLPFVQGMLDRMLMSFFKYGKVADAYPHKVDAIGSLFVRLIRYLGPDEFNRQVQGALRAIPATQEKQYGNTEYLMDAANFAMIEFMYPRLTNAYFKATDSNETPGRQWNNGAVHAGSNDNREAQSVYRRDGD